MRSRLALLAAGVLWSLGGVFIKALSGGVPGIQPVSAAGIVFYRSLFAAVALAVFLPRLWRAPPCPPQPPAGPRRFPLRDLLVSVALFAALLGLYVASTQGTTAANAIFLQYTAPVYVILLSPWLLKEPRRRSDEITLIIAGIGIAVLLIGTPAHSGAEPPFTSTGAPHNHPFNPTDSARVEPYTPLLMGLASGLFFGLFLLWLRRLRRLDPLGLTAWNNIGVAAVFLVILAVSGSADLWLPARAAAGGRPAVEALLTLAAMGVLQIAAPYVLFSTGLRGVSGVEASLVTLVEPVLNPVWVALRVGEYPAWTTVLGGMLILAALGLRYTLLRTEGES